ncbi:energy-coupled thiamine transporter ThiT [Enterococcus sp. AZ072]|uniref:energy-coupled thiamine transporter ThiT n=1 Tax=unclassified Enterococcus TaxID=2608891 RepID=UPI003D2D3FF2
MRKQLSLNVWIEGTLIAALAMSLSFLPIQSLNASLDLSLGLVPLVLYSFRRGLVPALMAGFTWGLLTIVVGSAMRNFISVPQIIFEYPFAFTFGGMGGLLSPKLQAAIKAQQKRKSIFLIVSGGFIAAFSRWFWHYWAGVFVWGAYAPDTMNPFLYSFILNGASALANAIFVSVVLVFIFNVSRTLFIPRESPKSL